MTKLSLIKVLVILSSILFTLNMCSSDNKQTKDDHSKKHWGYTGEGAPANWGKLDPNFATCDNGKEQSPIDLVSAKKSKKLKKIKFKYKTVKLQIVNNGHTIQVNYPAGSYAIIGGKRYELLQFHFHSPSEHTVNGSHFPMELHLVHKDADGKLAVVGLFLKKGKTNKHLKNIWKNLPTEINKPLSVNASFNIMKLLPKKSSYFNYPGSLTTPPCSEGVNWNVLVKPITVSSAQIKKFLNLIKENARPVQPLNNRVLLKKK